MLSPKCVIISVVFQPSLMLQDQIGSELIYFTQSLEQTLGPVFSVA